MIDARERCPLCDGITIGSMNTRYCRNSKCELCDTPIPGILLDKIAELQGLLDKEMKDHWHKHQIAIQLKKSLDFACGGLLKIYRCTTHTTPQGSIAYDTLCKLEKKPNYSQHSQTKE